MGLDLRADTHADNKPVQHLLKKHGFRYPQGSRLVGFKRRRASPCGEGGFSPYWAKRRQGDMLKNNMGQGLFTLRSSSLLSADSLP